MVDACAVEWLAEHARLVDAEGASEGLVGVVCDAG